MKAARILSLTLALILAFSLVMTVPALATGSHTVTFYTNSNMDEVFATQTVADKGYATKPENDPPAYTVDGYRYAFDTWYRKIDGAATEFDFANKKIRSDISLYAGYTQYLAEGYRLLVIRSGSAVFITDTTTPISSILSQYPGAQISIEKFEEGSGDTHTHNYDYDHPVWNWAEDYSSASVSIECLNAPTHTETVTASIAVNTTPASCVKTGSTVYTATATFDGKNYTDTKNVVIPMTDHNPVFQSAAWGDQNNTYGAYFSYKCSECGTVSEVFVPGTYRDSKGVRTYSATDSYGNTVNDEPITLKYTVTLNSTAQPEQYNWGDVCVLSGEDETPKAWYLVSGEKESLVADGVNSYSFAVTGNTAIVTKETENTQPQPVVTASIRSESVGTAVFETMWSLPSEAEVNSVMIYRGYTSTEKDVSVVTLVSKGSPFDTELLVHNGSYRLNMVNLTATRYQHVVIQIKYTLNGEVLTLNSAVQRVLPNGQS